MNNYIKVLLYLKQFEGDGIMYPVGDLFPELLPSTQIMIFEELAEEGFIDINRVSEKENEFEARITLKGSKFLKEELEMQESGKYNLNFWEKDFPFQIEYNNLPIENTAQFSAVMDEVIEKLKVDDSISEKFRKKAVSHFQKAKLKVDKSGILPKKFIKKTMVYEEKIGSIVSLIY